MPADWQPFFSCRGRAYLSRKHSVFLLPANFRSVQMTKDVESHSPTSGGGVYQEVKDCEDVEAGPKPGGQDHAAVSDAVCVKALDKAGKNVLMTVEETMEKL